jgi:hypothetical protein
MTTLRTPRLIAALLTLLLVAAGALAAVPAQAERFVHRDASRDVMKIRLLEEDGDALVPARHRRQGDYVKVKVWHQVKAVRVVGKFRQLDRKGYGLGQLVVIRTPDGFHTFDLFAGPGTWKGEVSAEGGSADCFRGYKVNYKRDRVSMRISRACLGRPEWVRVAAMFVTISRAADLSIDDATSKGLNRLRFTPRLAHGDPR